MIGEFEFFPVRVLGLKLRNGTKSPITNTPFTF